MDNKLICIECGREPQEYCAKCKERIEEENLSTESFWAEILDGIMHMHPAIFGNTVKNMACYPGRTLNQFLNGEHDRIQNPFSYFVLCASIYGFIIENFLKPKGWYVGVSRQLDIIQLGLIMLGLSLIARVICGRKFTLIQVFYVYAYVYGTAFLLNILIIWLEHYVLSLLQPLPGLWLIVVTDMPTTLFILTSIWLLFKRKNISWRPFLLTALVSFAYYLVMIWWFLYK